MSAPALPYGQNWPGNDAWADQDGTVHHGAAAGPQDGAEAHVPRRGLISGDRFIFDVPDQAPAVWGAGSGVLWSKGEPLLVTGPTGVGKTTLISQLIKCRMGLASSVLGMPVVTGGRVLMLAMDRPDQIRRAMARVLGRHDRAVVGARLTGWLGPPPEDLAKNPRLLLQLAHEADADTVVVDSLKDAAVGLVNDEVGQGIARAMNYLMADGIEVLISHHDRKTSGERADAPDALSTVYGSVHIPNSCGSVIRLHGTPGGTRIRLLHLKPPVELLAPIEVHHDHETGVMTVVDSGPGPAPGGEASEVLAALTEAPQTVLDVARLVHANRTVDRAQKQRVQRLLDRLVREQQAVKLPGGHRGAAGYAMRTF